VKTVFKNVNKLQEAEIKFSRSVNGCTIFGKLQLRMEICTQLSNGTIENKGIKEQEEKQVVNTLQQNGQYHTRRICSSIEVR
jgi:hypothetical protein